MGEASANMAHWAGLYGAATAGGNGGAAATAEGSGVTVSSPTSGGSGGGSPARSAPGVEGGRVGKPARRRSRASRRAPVTLLNTDTSNFRAMVQQFTGIPSGPYGPAGGGPVISFGAGGSSGVGMPVRPSPTSAVMSFDHLGGQYQQQQHRPAVTSSLHQQQQQQQSQLFRPQQQQQYGGDFGAMLGGGGGGGDIFLHGFGSSVEDRMLLQSIQAAQMMPRPASTNNTNGYNFG